MAAPAVDRLVAALEGEEDVVLSGVVLQEVLQAFRHPSTFAKMARYLEPFVLLSASRLDFTEAARIHRKCASRGISASTTDCIIAQMAIRHGCELLTTDKDFERVATVCSLKLAIS